MTYIESPIVADEKVLVDAALDSLMAAIPGWVPREGNLEVWLIEIIGAMAAESATIASRVPRSIFRYFGQSLLNLLPIVAAPAGALTTWTAQDDLGYVIPPGTHVAYNLTGSDVRLFVTTQAGTIPPGSTTVTDVPIVSVNPGSRDNALPATTVECVDALVFVSAVVTTTATSGGADGESDDDYLDRLAEELQTMTPRPILPHDFAVLARLVPGVERAMAIDGYNPGDLSFGNERMVTVAVVDVDGANVSGAVKTAVEDLLEAKREVNFEVHVIDPTTTNITVAFNARSLPDANNATVHDAAVAAVTDYLDRANWGTYGDPHNWTTVTKVRYLEIAGVLNNVPGLDYVTSLTVNAGTVDVDLAGVAPLPSTVSVTGTVS